MSSKAALFDSPKKIRPGFVPWLLLIFSALVALALAAPMLFIVYQGLTADPSIWQRLWRLGRLQTLFINTFILTLIVTTGTLFLGVALAWLTERTNVPGKRWWTPLLSLPLLIPGYLLAIAYESFWSRWGLLAEVLTSWGMNDIAAIVPSITGLLGASIVLILSLYPYVYLLARAALRGVNTALEDTARTCGLNPRKFFWFMTLPLIRPSLVAAALLVAVMTMADYAVVARMGFPTFTNAVYSQLTTRLDRSTASVLSLALIVATVLLIMFQLYLWGKGRHYYRTSRQPIAPEASSSRGLMLILIVVLSAFLLPVGIFLYWMVQGWLHPTQANAIWGTGLADLLRFAWHGLLSAGSAATLALALALPMAYLSVRYRDRKFSRGFAWLSQAGLALPGVLVALGLALVLHRTLPELYFSVAALVIAYLILFFPFAFQTLESGLTQIPQSLEEAARMLRQKTVSVWRHVTLPLLVPGLMTAWVFVFTNALRELPATLLLRPPGFDTLPVRIWIAAGEGYLTQAAPAALLLIALSLPLLFLLDPVRTESKRTK